MNTLIVGSANPVKIAAVREVAKSYPCLAGATVAGVSVPSGVSNQPMTMEETIRGAENRAERAFEAGSFSFAFGLESGLFRVAERVMEVTTCAVYDGERMHIGVSPAFELPHPLVEVIQREDVELVKALVLTGLAEDEGIRHQEGLSGWATKGRSSRQQACELALQMAMVPFERAEWYAAGQTLPSGVP